MRTAIEELESLVWTAIMAHPGFWVEQFVQLSEAAMAGSRASESAALVQRGRAALDRQDVDALRAVCGDLLRIIPSEEQPDTRLKHIGLRV